MPIISQTILYHWTSMSLARCNICERTHFGNPGKMDMGILELRFFSKGVYFLNLSNFFKNGSPGQTTMLTRRTSKFCAKPRSPFSEISQQESKTIGKLLHTVSWPECRPELKLILLDSLRRVGVPKVPRQGLAHV